MSIETYFILKNLDMYRQSHDFCPRCLEHLPKHKSKCVLFKFLVARELPYTLSNYELVLSLARKIKRKALFKSVEYTHCDFCYDGLFRYVYWCHIQVFSDSRSNLKNLNTFRNTTKKHFLHHPDCPMPWIP